MVLNDKTYTNARGRKQDEKRWKKQEEANITEMLASPGNIVATELSSGIAFAIQLFEHAM